jgi:peptide/nickel transport system substrate-binding protein
MNGARTGSRALHVLAVIVAAQLALAVVPVTPGNAQTRGTLVYATRVEPRCIDPGNQVDQQTLRVLRNAYEPLVSELQGSVRLGPGLATRWDISQDSRVFTFSLRPNVKFADGTPFNAESVKFTFDRIKKLGLAVASVLDTVERVEVADAQTVRIRLSRPDVYFLYGVAKVGIVSPTAATRNQDGEDMGNKWLCRNTAGTGPYQLAQWQPNQFMLMQRNPTYWQGWTGKHIETVRLIFVPENATQLQLLERLEIDMVSTPFINETERLRANPKLRVIIAPAIETDIFTYNVTKPPLNDVRVRRAVSLAFDYEAMARQVWRGYGRVPRGFLPEGMECFDKSIAPQRQDLARVRELLQQANVSSGTITLGFTRGREDMKQAAAILQDTLRGFGLQLQVQEIPWPTLFEMHKTAATAPHVGSLIMGAFTGDPASFMELNFHSRNIDRPYNWSFWKNAEFDKLIDDARATPDAARRCGLLGRAQKILVDEAPAMYVANPPKVEAITARVKGYYPHPIDYYWSTRFYPMYLSE